MKFFPVFSTSLAQELDQKTINHFHLHDDVLMELAGSKAADWLAKKNPHSILVLVGPGNNGGDGLVLARHLALLKPECSIFVHELFPQKRNPLATKNWQRLQPLLNSNRIIQLEAIDHYRFDYVVDAVFGTGLQRSIEPALAKLFDEINQQKEIQIVAIDCPSGIEATTGSILGNALKADFTLTFGGKKTGFYMDEAYAYLGEIEVIPIGFDSNLVNTPFFEVDLDSLEPKKLKRKHKYDDGYVSVIAGSANLSGAAYLACAAALSAGAAAVELYYPKGLFPVFDMLLPDVLKKPVGNDSDFFFSENHVDWIVQSIASGKRSVVFGPGIGREKATEAFVHQLIPHLPEKTVVDADALYHLSSYNSSFPFPFCLTPHVGELSKLTGISIKTDFERINQALLYSQNRSVYVFSKGTYGAFLSPDGQCTFLPYTNHFFRKTGFGDVFSGYLAANWLTDDNIKTSFARTSQELWKKAQSYKGENLSPKHLITL